MHYRYNSVEEMEKAWRDHLIATKKQPQELLASGHGAVDGKVVVRQTAPPLGDQPRPVYRGQAADETVMAPYGYLPEFTRPVVPTTTASPSSPAWPGTSPQGQVYLGAPMFEQPTAGPVHGAQVQLGQPIFATPVAAGPSR